MNKPSDDIEKRAFEILKEKGYDIDKEVSVDLILATLTCWQQATVEWIDRHASEHQTKEGLRA